MAFTATVTEIFPHGVRFEYVASGVEDILNLGFVPGFAMAKSTNTIPMWLWTRGTTPETVLTATGSAAAAGISESPVATSAGTGLLIATSAICNLSGQTYFGFAGR